MDTEYAELESRIEALEKENRQFFSWGWVVVLVLNILALIKVAHTFIYQMPRFEKMFIEMLAGKPLPAVTRMTIALGNMPVMAAGLLVATLAIWGGFGSKRNLPLLLGFGVITWIIQMTILMVGTNAQFSPLFRLIERLG